jgi:hypothetical protein
MALGLALLGLADSVTQTVVAGQSVRVTVLGQQDGVGVRCSGDIGGTNG